MLNTQRTRHRERLRCSVCGDVVGVYEPLLVMEMVGPRVTSIAREPALRDNDEVDVAHRDCGGAAAGPDQ